MPFVSEVDRRSFEDRLTPAEFEAEATFGETFDAAFGLAVDEEQSISALYNNEMYARRQQQTRELIDQGLIDRDQYTDRRGRFDYDRAATDLRSRFEGLGRPGEVPDMIKTDAELRTERNEILRIRREEAQDVLSRGSGIAQFAGTASALILDPVNFAALGYGLTIGTAKGLSTIGRALYTARTEAAIAAAAETAIQPFVFAHKNDIESPYAIEDALANIGTATAFAGGLGLVAGGAAGYFRNVREKSREAIAKQPFELTPEQAAAREEARISLEAEIDETLANLDVKRADAGSKDIDGLFDEVSIAYNEAKRESTQLFNSRQDYLDDLTLRRDAGEIDEAEFNRLALEGEPVVAYKKARDRRQALDRLLDDIAGVMHGDGVSGELRTAFDTLRKPEELVEAKREKSVTNPNRIYDDEYQRFLEGETKTLEEARGKTVAEMQKQIRKLEKQDIRLISWIKENGGLNKESWKREFGLEDSQMTAKAGWGVGIWRAGKGGMAPDELGVRLEHDPTLAFEFQYSRTAPSTTDKDKVFEWFEPLISDKTIPLYPEIRMEIEQLEQGIRQLEESEIDTLDSLYKDAATKVMADDMETLAEYYRVEQRMNQPSRIPEDYDQPIHVLDLEETDIQVKSVERQVLSKEGVSEAHDEIMAEYRKLTDEERAIQVEGEDVNADELIAGYEKDLEGLDELIRCTRSA